MTSVDLADPDEMALTSFKEAWHEDLYRWQAANGHLIGLPEEAPARRERGAR